MIRGFAQEVVCIECFHSFNGVNLSIGKGQIYIYVVPLKKNLSDKLLFSFFLEIDKNNH